MRVNRLNRAMIMIVMWDGWVKAIWQFCGFSIDHVWEEAIHHVLSKPCRWIFQFLYGYHDSWWKYAVTVPLFYMASYSTYPSRGVVDACFQILLLDFNPRWHLFYICSVLFCFHYPSRDPQERQLRPYIAGSHNHITIKWLERPAQRWLEPRPCAV